MLNTLQGLHRDTGVRVQELSLGVHEHPFLCPDYEQRDRRFVTEFLDLPRYGAGFERFVAIAVGSCVGVAAETRSGEPLARPPARLPGFPTAATCRPGPSPRRP